MSKKDKFGTIAADVKFITRAANVEEITTKETETFLMN
jgi:hypothetical protein